MSSFQQPCHFAGIHFVAASIPEKVNVAATETAAIVACQNLSLLEEVGKQVLDYK
jgi:hypothetical protein